MHVVELILAEQNLCDTKKGIPMPLLVVLLLDRTRGGGAQAVYVKGYSEYQTLSELHSASTGRRWLWLHC